MLLVNGGNHQVKFLLRVQLNCKNLSSGPIRQTHFSEYQIAHFTKYLELSEKVKKCSVSNFPGMERSGAQSET